MKKSNITITMSLLVGIGEKSLKKYLEPIQSLLEENNLWWVEPKDFKPRELAVFLKTSLRIPKDILDFLNIIGTLSKDDCESLLMDAFISTEYEVPTSVTNAALKLWEISKDKCISIIVRVETLRKRKYSYFRPTKKLEGVVLESPSKADIKTLESNLSDWFKSQHKGQYVLVLSQEIEEWIYFSVFHGTLIKRENDVESGEVSVVSYRPETSDFVRINKYTGILGIHLSTRSNVIQLHYTNVFGKLFEPKIEYVARSCYTLEPLKDENKVLILGDLKDKISLLKLKKVSLNYNGSSVEISGGEFKSLWADWSLNKSVFKKAEFEVTYRDEPKKPKTFTLTPPYSIDFPENYEDEDLNVLLRENGFLVDEEYEDVEIQEEFTDVLQTV